MTIHPPTPILVKILDYDNEIFFHWTKIASYTFKSDRSEGKKSGKLSTDFYLAVLIFFHYRYYKLLWFFIGDAYAFK
jgi:hypothetical protein